MTMHRTDATGRTDIWRWGADLSAPQQIAVGALADYLALGSRPVSSPANCRWGADRSAIWRWEQTCRLSSKLPLRSRQVGYLALGADLSAPQQIAVEEPTGRLSGAGSRPVGSPANCRWGADRSVPQNIAVR